MIQTLLNRQYPEELFEQFRLLVFDEAHHVGAPSFSRCMRSLQLPYTLGLTATPRRKDGLQKLLHWVLGPMAHQETMDRKDVVVQVVKFACTEFDQPQPINRQGNVDSCAVISTLVDNARRNDKIVEIVDNAHAEGRDILVLTHRRAHCEYLAKTLQQKGVDVGLCMGKIKDTRHKVLVATYALVSEGFDEPRLNTLVLATPASDVTQAAGRILRSKNPDLTPLIVNVYDFWGSCHAQFSKRKGFYTKSGFRLV